MHQLIIFLTCFLTVSGQLLFPIPINLRLPSPQSFIEEFLNVTSAELIDLVSDFSFEEISSEDIVFLKFETDGTVKKLDVNPKYLKIDRNKPMKFLVHGWQGTGDQEFIKDFSRSYHAIGIKNVFAINWESHSKRSYVHSARSVRKIGEIVAHFVMNVVKNDTESLSNVHLIGHSLGAHISGIAGKKVQDITNGTKIGRITALDAAGPLFELPVRVPDYMRLTNEDGKFVDSIHSNAGFLGYTMPFADADFYLNFGGPIQAGCGNINLFESFVCSHAKSYEVYNKTIESKDFIATLCENPLRALATLCDDYPRVVLGEHVDRTADGVYFITIDSRNLPDERTVGTRSIFWG